MTNSEPEIPSKEAEARVYAAFDALLAAVEAKHTAPRSNPAAVSAGVGASLAETLERDPNTDSNGCLDEISQLHCAFQQTLTECMPRAFADASAHADERWARFFPEISSVVFNRLCIKARIGSPVTYDDFVISNEYVTPNFDRFQDERDALPFDFMSDEYAFLERLSGLDSQEYRDKLINRLERMSSQDSVMEVILRLVQIFGLNPGHVYANRILPICIPMQQQGVLTVRGIVDALWSLRFMRLEDK